MASAKFWFSTNPFTLYSTLHTQAYYCRFRKQALLCKIKLCREAALVIQDATSLKIFIKRFLHKREQTITCPAQNKMDLVKIKSSSS